MFGSDVQSRLKSGGFDDPSSESARAAAVLEEEFGADGDGATVFVRLEGTEDRLAAAVELIAFPITAILLVVIFALDRTGDDRLSVARGLERTGRNVTAAAVLIAVVFLAFATGRVSFMKMFGLGMTLAVLVDAVIVLTTLVAAFMRLAGRANWWAPGPLRRLHDRIGFCEVVDLEDDLTAPTSTREPVHQI